MSGDLCVNVEYWEEKSVLKKIKRYPLPWNIEFVMIIEKEFAVDTSTNTGRFQFFAGLCKMVDSRQKTKTVPETLVSIVPSLNIKNIL